MMRCLRMGVLTLVSTSLTIGLAVAAVAQTEEIAGVEVTAQLPPVIHQGETFSTAFLVSNVGEAVYHDVLFSTADACGPSANGGLIEFTELAGDGNDLLEPGEAWSYLAPECLDWAVPFATATLSVSDGVATLSGSYSFDYEPASPIAVETIGDVAVDDCLLAAFEIPFQVVTGSSLDPPDAYLSLAVDDGSGGLTVVKSTQFTEITFVTEQGNAVFDPGEEFVARFFFGTLNQCQAGPQDLPDPPLQILLTMSGSNHVSGAPWCLGTHGCPYDAVEVGRIVSLVPSTRPTDDPSAPENDIADEVDDAVLPFTGAHDLLVLVAGLSLLLGALVVATSNRRRSGERSQGL